MENHRREGGASARIDSALSDAQLNGAEAGVSTHALEVAAFLAQLQNLGIELTVEAGQLRYRCPAGVMTAELAAGLKARREQLVSYLGGRGRLSVGRIPDQPTYELSHAQLRMWFLSQLESAASAYHIPLRLLLEGPVDAVALEGALRATAARHESLRTTIVVIDGEPRQAVHPSAAGLRLHREDFSAESDPEAQARRFAEADAAEAFDLASGPLLRAALLKLSADRHIFCLTAHHLVCDGWSLRVLMQDLRAFYEAAIRGQPAVLDPLPIHYRDFAAWQNGSLAGAEGGARRDYWLAKLAGELPVLELPCDSPRPAFQSFAGDVFTVHFGGEEYRALAAFARSRQCSVFTLLVALIKVLLHRHTGQRDIIVGTAVAGRGPLELERQIGCYINTLPLRSQIEPAESFDLLLREVRQTLVEALDHQDYPFDHLIESLKQPRDFSRSPLIDVMVISQTAAELNTGMGGARVSHLSQLSRVSKFDLTFDIEEGPGFLHAGIEYASGLFSRARIERMGGHLQMLARAALAEPGLAVGRLPMLPADESAAILRQQESTALEVAPETVVARIASAAARFADRTAIVCGADAWTYAVLEKRVCAIAAALRVRGIKRGDVAAVLVDRSPDLIAALLGVMRAGAAYLPLDPIYPAERLATMVQDSGARILLSDGASRTVASALSCPMLDLRDPMPAGDHARELPGFHDLAYVIYTSGSTGRPKGVQIPHAALANFLASMERAPGLQESDSLLAITTVCFDIAALELFLPLCVGARVVIADRDTVADGEALRQLLAKEKISCLQATPAGWRTLLAAGWEGTASLRAWCGGEALTPELAEQLLARTAEIWNLYGPTETTVWSAAQRVTSPGKARAAEPIGPPIANTQLYALDESLSPAPIGVRGELYIGGDGLSWGYRGRPALTAEKFLPDPFSATPGARMYRAGDLVRLTESGTFDFLGRADHQVKTRGFRVELGEIETALAAHPEVAQAAVTAHPDRSGDMVLAAYFAPKNGQHPGGLREFLGAHLPAYMVPAFFICLPKLPLTENGKVNRRALPVPDYTAGEDRVLPRTATEQRLAELWERVLEIHGPGVHDSFFDLGGHSLRAVKILAAIKREFGVSIALRDFFARPTIAQVAEALRHSTFVRPTARRIGKAKPVTAVSDAITEDEIHLAVLNGLES